MVRTLTVTFAFLVYKVFVLVFLCSVFRVALFVARVIVSIESQLKAISVLGNNHGDYVRSL